jgi:hypothetical protein
MYPDDATETTPCAVCDQPARERVHRGCRDRMADALRELPGLYRQLQDALVPSRRGGDGRTATKTAPIPTNEEALDLRGPGEETIVGVLTRWEDHVRAALDWEPRPFRGCIEQTVAGSAPFLLLQLPWICEQNQDAVQKFATEIGKIAGRARRLVEDERPPIRIPVACRDCGHILRVSLDMDGIRCTRCQKQYDHRAMLELTPTRRAAA